jgi:hypothetical protein
MSNSHKKTQKQQHRPKVNEDKVNNDDYVQMEVRGDGNCFYYSVYGAAKYHVDPTVFGKLLACLEIENKPTLTPQEFARKVRAKLAREIIKPIGIMEAQEAVAVERRGALEFREQTNGNLFTMMLEASKHIWAPTETIEYKDLERMQRESEKSLEQAKTRYKAAAESAAKKTAVKDIAKFIREVRQAKKNIIDIIKPATGRAHWNAILQEVAREIQDHPLLGNARAYERMTKQQFKDAFVRILAGDALDGDSFMYASQPDVEILQFFLSKCGTPLKLLTVNPNRDRFVDFSNGIPVLNVVLLFRGGYEHYNYYVRGDKYKEHIDRFEKPAVKVKKQHVAKGNTPETPKTPEPKSNSSLPPNSNSSNSTKRKKKSSATTKAAATATAPATTKAAATAAAKPQNMQAARLKLAQMRAEKAAKEDAQKAAAAAVAARKATPVPSGKNVTKHPAIKQWNPFNSNTEASNNNANNASNIPLSVIEEGKRLEELRKARAANAAAAAAAPRPIPSAPPASPPRTNSTRKAKKPSSPAKGKSMSPTTRKLYNELMAKEQPLTGFSAAAVANNLPSNSNNSLSSNGSNNEDSALQAALKASKEEHEKNAKNKGRKALIEGILAQYKQPAPSILPPSHPSQRLPIAPASKTQEELIASIQGTFTRKNKK